VLDLSREQTALELRRGLEGPTPGGLLKAPSAASASGAKPRECVAFDYLHEGAPVPRLLKENGWSVPDSLAYAGPEVLNWRDDPDYRRVLSFYAPTSFALDYAVNPLATCATLVRFVVFPRVQQGYDLYIKVRLREPSGKVREEPVNLNIKLGDATPAPYGSGETEWSLYVDPKHGPGDWLVLEVDLKQAVSKTFGTMKKQRWEYDTLLGYRLRGHIKCAEITAS
jgi:hypothetical protein